MSDLTNKVLEQSANPGIKYMNISRRMFLKGAMAVCGAVALAGCGPSGNNTTTTVGGGGTSTPPGGGTPTVNPEPPKGITYASNIPINTMSYILPDYTKCIGCKKCMVYCSFEHYGVPDLYLSNIRVDMAYIDGGRADMPFLCMKCGNYTAYRAPAPATETTAAVEERAEIYGIQRGEDADGNPVIENNIPCHAACPPAVNAITKDPVTGAMLVDNIKCIGCNMCVLACEEKGAGILRLSRDQRSVVGMCDLCSGEPKCVLACPEGCLKVYATPGNINNATYIVKPEELAKRLISMTFGVEWDESQVYASRNLANS